MNPPRYDTKPRRGSDWRLHGIVVGMALCLASLTAGAMAQETAGVNPTSGGAVIKGKAPVAKELLMVRFPRPKSFTLSNGLTVYVLEDHRLPAVRFRLIMRAGSLFEPKPGIAEMTASMLTEGTQSRTFLQLAQESEDIGATIGVTAGTDTATLSASGLSESTDTLIGMMADVLLHPAFPSDRLDRMKFQQ